MKSAMIDYLKSHNNECDISEVVTRLYYNNGEDFVEDYSRYANNDYMSEGLLVALANRQTLTDKQSMELEEFRVDGTLQ